MKPNAFDFRQESKKILFPDRDTSCYCLGYIISQHLEIREECFVNIDRLGALVSSSGQGSAPASTEIPFWLLVFEVRERALQMG